MNTPEIIKLTAKKLIGIGIQTSLAENSTLALWQKFKPLVHEVKNRENTNFYSIQIYENDFDMRKFTLKTTFEKWAAVEVQNFENIPEKLKEFNLSGGKYAVFIHKGRPEEFHKTAKFIYQEWIPNSNYKLDNRPHFEIMSKDYNPNDSNAEEEVWIPIR